MEEVVVEVEGNGMEVRLSRLDLQRLRSGVSSVPVDENVVHCAAAHAFHKTQHMGAADEFIRRVYDKPEAVKGTDGMETESSPWSDFLYGPVGVLEPSMCRFVRLGPLMSALGVYAVHDRRSIALLDVRGQCVLLKWEQVFCGRALSRLISVIPAYVLYQREDDEERAQRLAHRPSPASPFRYAPAHNQPTDFSSF